MHRNSPSSPHFMTFHYNIFLKNENNCDIKTAIDFMDVVNDKIDDTIYGAKDLVGFRMGIFATIRSRNLHNFGPM
ncbi:hypothetical protein UM89_04400 [Bacillus subtilis]|nr:hypothetical protein UM89_04400 [Bacillus subtilis]